MSQDVFAIFRSFLVLFVLGGGEGGRTCSGDEHVEKELGRAGDGPLICFFGGAMYSGSLIRNGQIVFLTAMSML